jgi:hypothetical protein
MWKYLWVDVPCINQTDIDERNTQVGMMGDIYANADTVIIWLGKADSDASEAMPLIEEFARQLVQPDLEFVGNNWENFTFNDPAFYALTYPPMAQLSPYQWRSIVSFISRN